LGGEKHGTGREHRIPVFGGFPCAIKWLGLHDHARTASVGEVVGGAVLIMGVIADLMEVDVKKAFSASAAQNARF
jgi:hypothetical protein